MGGDEKKAQAGACIWLSQEEARLPLVPPLCPPLGVKGPRPVVGTWDNKDVVYRFATLNVGSGQLPTRLVESPAKAKPRTGLSKTARLQRAFATPLRAIARTSPASLHKPVILTIANAPWHRSAGIADVLATHQHLRR
jgi:hypothetical protein